MPSNRVIDFNQTIFPHGSVHSRAEGPRPVVLLREAQRLFYDFCTSTISIKIFRAETTCGAGGSCATVLSGAAIA
jgi:hypothetical protein